MLKISVLVYWDFCLFVLVHGSFAGGMMVPF